MSQAEPQSPCGSRAKGSAASQCGKCPGYASPRYPTHAGFGAHDLRDPATHQRGPPGPVTSQPREAPDPCQLHTRHTTRCTCTSPPSTPRPAPASPRVPSPAPGRLRLPAVPLVARPLPLGARPEALDFGSVSTSRVLDRSAQRRSRTEGGRPAGRGAGTVRRTGRGGAVSCGRPSLARPQARPQTLLQPSGPSGPLSPGPPPP